MRPFPTLAALISILLLGQSLAADLPGGISLRCEVTPTRLQPGQRAELAVTVQLPPGWIIYDLEQVPNSVLPTTLEIDPVVDLAPLETFRSEGAKEERDPKFRNRLVRFFAVSPTFRRPLRVSEEARPGERTIQGKIGFLAQYLLTKRFYIVSRANFEATVVIDPPPAPASSDDRLEFSSGEQTISEEETRALLAPPPPRPPVPPFHISIHSPAPPRHAPAGREIPWNVAFLASVILTTMGVASGVLTPPSMGPVGAGWIDQWLR